MKRYFQYLSGWLSFDSSFGCSKIEKKIFQKNVCINTLSWNNIVYTTIIIVSYLKISIRPLSWLAFMMLPIPPTWIYPKMITNSIEIAVKKLWITYVHTTAFNPP